MKQRVLLTILAFMCFTHMGLCQYTPEYFKVGNTGEFLKPHPVKGAVVTEVFMDTVWKRTNILLYKGDQRLNGVWSRYNLRNNEMELLFDKKDVKVLDARLIRSLAISDMTDSTHFVNGKDYKVNGVPRILLMEVLAKGKISLLKEHSFEIKPPDYNIALAVGNKDEMVFMRDFLYLANGADLTKVGSKKKLLEMFGAKRGDMEKYMKDKKLNPSHVSDLVEILNYFNSSAN